MTDKTKMTILVVDDTLENVTLLSRILKMSGYNIQVASSGTQAVDVAKTLLPDLILLDINMPVMDGFEACARLKEDERTREIPVIFISALDSIEDKVRAFRAGGVDYILKPFEYEEVQARVETHLDIRRLRVQLELANRELATRINELTNSRELLAERERKLSAFVSALPNLSFILNEEGRYLEVLANETDLLPAKLDQLVGSLVEKVIPPQVAVMMMDAIRQAILTGKIQIIEYEIPVIAGGRRWFEGRVTLMEKDEAGHSKVVFVATEISERIQLYQEVQRLANEDVLTSCFNRRHFMVLATQEIHRAMRYKRPLSLLMLDIDHFKGFNDRYGHQIGDQLLCYLVNLCQKQLRSVDILGRYGGEEFVVVMPETTADGALQAAERLRAKIEKMVIDTSEGKLSVTVSIGLTSLERGFDQSQTLDMLIKRADQALYAAKAAGRNCVRAWQDKE
jgi:diguanylate cyclase (GGDEF)-like protein/PAS domain S-box-containing protein